MTLANSDVAAPLGSLAEHQHGIFALATGNGAAAIAILRLSGAPIGPALIALCGRLPPPRQATLRRLRDSDGAVLDHALVLWMPAPHSYTGEDCAELHLHGGHAVIDAVSDALSEHGLRPAEPGEFSRRAFLNGRMDLLEAEAVADLVAADTAAQRRQALRQLEGETSRLYAGWLDTLRRQVAIQEALVDFPDEALPDEVEACMLDEVAKLASTLQRHLADGHAAERLRDGVVVAITGAPNVGKSSLLNALCGHPTAIVAEEAGTTRDVVSSRIVLAGVPVTLLDTAGLRVPTGAVEAEGVRRAEAAAATADIVLRVVAPDVSISHALPAAALIVANKADLGPVREPAAFACSTRTGVGLAALRTRLAKLVADQVRSEGPPVLSRARHRAAMIEAATHLQAALHARLPELRAESLRLAHLALGRVCGVSDVDAIIDEVFARFCIGK